MVDSLAWYSGLGRGVPLDTSGVPPGYPAPCTPRVPSILAITKEKPFFGDFFRGGRTHVPTNEETDK